MTVEKINAKVITLPIATGANIMMNWSECLAKIITCNLCKAQGNGVYKVLVFFWFFFSLFEKLGHDSLANHCA